MHSFSDLASASRTHLMLRKRSRHRRRHLVVVPATTTAAVPRRRPTCAVVHRPVVHWFDEVGIAAAAAGTFAITITTATIAIGFWRKRSDVLLLLLLRRRRRRRWQCQRAGHAEAIWHRRGRHAGPRGPGVRDSHHQVVSRRVVQVEILGHVIVAELGHNLQVRVRWTKLKGEKNR